MVLENFEIASFFMRNHWYGSVTFFDDVTTPYGTLLGEENRDFPKKTAKFRVFECFPCLEHECSVSPT